MVLSVIMKQTELYEEAGVRGEIEEMRLDIHEKGGG